MCARMGRHSDWICQHVSFKHGISAAATGTIPAVVTAEVFMFQRRGSDRKIINPSPVKGVDLDPCRLPGLGCSRWARERWCIPHLADIRKASKGTWMNFICVFFTQVVASPANHEYSSPVPILGPEHPRMRNSVWAALACGYFSACFGYAPTSPSILCNLRCKTFSCAESVF